MSISALTTENLSVEEQYRLITDIQNVPTTVERLEDGSEYVTYGVTPASEEAGAQLLAAFMPAIQGAAWKTKLKGQREEAEAVALEAFVRAVREYDLTSDTPFHHIVPNLMRQAVLRMDRDESSQLTVPEVQIARYFRALHAYDQDPVRAYEMCSLTPSRFDISGPSFLAVHYAIHGVDSLDAPQLGGSGSLAGSYGGTVADFADEVATHSHEDEVLTKDYVRWLLTHVTDVQERICRLAYGFADLPTESLRVAHGYRATDCLDDLQAADCLDMARSTVQRQRVQALASMREAAEDELRGE